MILLMGLIWLKLLVNPERIFILYVRADQLAALKETNLCHGVLYKALV
jgi:hypothetical protein